MILFSAIGYYASRVAALKNVKRGIYATVEDEVKAAFKGCTIEQIRQNYKDRGDRYLFHGITKSVIINS